MYKAAILINQDVCRGMSNVTKPFMNHMCWPQLTPTLPQLPLSLGTRTPEPQRAGGGFSESEITLESQAWGPLGPVLSTQKAY